MNVFLFFLIDECIYIHIELEINKNITRKQNVESPDSMTRSTCDSFDPQVLGSGANGDTVVTSFDGSVTNFNIS